MQREEITRLFETWCRKLRIVPAWDVVLERAVAELTKCSLLEFGETKELSYGRCKHMPSYNELFDGLKNL